MTITCGIDWAEGHHDVALLDEMGKVIARRRIDTGAAGFQEVLAVIAEHGGSPEATPVAIETDKNLIVVALAGAGFTVYPINPRAAARYRERFHQSGKKSDAGDAALLADIIRTDRHQHRPLPAVSNDGRAVKALARQHQEAIWALMQTTSRLRSLLLEFYPQALRAFPNLNHKAALEVLGAAPTPTRARTLTVKRIVMLLHRAGRRNDPGLADKIRSAFQAPALAQPQQVEAWLGVAVATLIGIVRTMLNAVDDLRTAMDEQFQAHPQAHILTSVPGLGPVLGARVLGEIGDDPDRFPTAAGLRSYAGTAPVTRASGRSSYVKARKIRDKRLADACHWWAFAAPTRSTGARAHYDRRRAIGDTHNAALRNLANKMIGKLWWCLHNDRTWDDATAWNTTDPTPQLAAA
ncbi:IS110 family transposase [Nakamurella sp. YIM 132087]|uniref:IS110 family transposase n=1 Tax=Nakamurella alba TaxID=2665158 RepID=A0A7K1FTM7_9ACTN|nr:IS110 family transposase [Nakamurella alba]MTD17478.1 IS110 family transposase [Nakamurella alba]